MIVSLLLACASATPAGLQQARTEIARPGAEPLTIRATWPPSDARPLPVIVFSHGMGGSAEGYGPLAERWAREGYLVLQPTHPDSLSLRPPLERLRLARDLQAFVADPINASAWDDRPVEIARVLDMLERPGELGWLAEAGLDPDRIDRSHVGLAGHSFGAHTAMLCGGVSAAGVGDRFREPRADALLLMSPQGTGPLFSAESYGSITLPTLMVTGSKDRGVRGGEDARWRMEVWENLQAPDRWLLWLEGATHGLGGISGARRQPVDPPLLDAVLQTTSSFWDATLRADAEARARLDAGGAPPGHARVRLTRGEAASD